jgi:hypothetical protein
MNLAQEIQRAENSIQWLDSQADGLEFKADKRSLLAAGCFDMAVEHQKAIVMLIANRLSGSALSLVRLHFESFVRGLWLQHCATDAQLDRFSNDQQMEKFAVLLEAVEKQEGYRSGVLSRAKLQSWKAMNSFAHTGIKQVSRRYYDGHIQGNYSEEELIEIIRFSCAIGWLVAIAICILTDSALRADAILRKAQELFPEAIGSSDS